MRQLTGIYLILGLNLLATAFLLYTVHHPSQDQLKALHYMSETATLVSPHSLREQLAHGEQNYVIVDTRDAESYRRGHIITAINIEPGPGMVDEFRALEKANPNKEILIYCYTEVCMRGRKIGTELVKNEVYVWELGVGFNEWKNFWREWNYENEWDHINMDDYIIQGDAPGTLPEKSLEELLEPSACGADPAYSC